MFNLFIVCTYVIYVIVIDILYNISELSKSKKKLSKL